MKELTPADSACLACLGKGFVYQNDYARTCACRLQNMSVRDRLAYMETEKTPGQILAGKSVEARKKKYGKDFNAHMKAIRNGTKQPKVDERS